MSRLAFGLSLPIHLISLLLLLSNVTAEAPVSCTYSCPSTDVNGRVLTTLPYSTPYDGPYSIFDCVYATPGTPTLHACRYYKVDGVRALGSSRNSDCPTRAVPCLDNSTPRFSTPDKIELPPWIGPGDVMLWHKENPPTE